MIKPFAERKHEDMRQVLMKPDSPGPDIHYYMIRGGTEKTNITVWEPGTVGGEYIKAYGHYHVGKISETYRILTGEGILMLQRRGMGADGAPVDDEVTACYAVRVKSGDSLFIPSGIGHLLINTGEVWLTAVDDSPVNFSESNAVSMPGHADYEPVRKMKGFAYYVIENTDGGLDTGARGDFDKVKFIKNPNYKNTPDIIKLTSEEYTSLIAKNPSL